MKNRIECFLICLCIVAMCAFIPLENNHENRGSVDSEFRNIYLYAQSKNFRIEKSSVSVNSMKEHEIIFMETGDLKLVTRHNKQRYFVKLTEF